MSLIMAPTSASTMLSRGDMRPLIPGGAFSRSMELPPVERSQISKTLAALRTACSVSLRQNQPLRMETSVSAG